MVYIITGAFILLDMITGIVKAFASKTYTSSIMREGLFHKCGTIICVAFGSLVDYAQQYVYLGFELPVTIPVASIMCGYIIAMECGSIFENVCEINPNIAPDGLKAHFQKLQK